MVHVVWCAQVVLCARTAVCVRERERQIYYNKWNIYKRKKILYCSVHTHSTIQGKHIIPLRVALAVYLYMMYIPWWGVALAHTTEVLMFVFERLKHLYSSCIIFVFWISNIQIFCLWLMFLLYCPYQAIVKASGPWLKWDIFSFFCWFAACHSDRGLDSHLVE